MGTTVKDRILAFIEYKGISKNKFEVECGLSKRYVSNISQSISPEVSKKISLTYPELNMGWVLTGSGQMLYEGYEETEKEMVTLAGDAMRIFLNMSSTILKQEENISKLTDMVDRLTGGLPKKEEAVG